ncbi:MAG: hypothetical protein OXT71_11955 [Acidobacteriota bacterium]|nr:hypothetical protein [Acidobacteriota bacterium]
MLSALEIVALVDPVDSRIIQIVNMLKLGEVLASEKYSPEVRERSDLEVVSSSDDMAFDAHGNLAPVAGQPFPNLSVPFLNTSVGATPLQLLSRIFLLARYFVYDARKIPSDRRRVPRQGHSGEARRPRPHGCMGMVF